MTFGLGSISQRRSVRTRSISAENPTGAPGAGGRAIEGLGAECARELGQKWKVAPAVEIAAGETFVVADIEGPGRITHIWSTVHSTAWRSLLVRMYWDGDTQPAVEVPLGDFFAQGAGVFAPVSSVPVAANPLGGLNSYWPMPFASGARITVENVSPVSQVFFYQVTYEEGGDAVGENYFHAQWRRSNPLPYGTNHVLLSGIEGQGQYVGTYLSWGSNTNGWWGEGEIKFYLDDDTEFPTICGTGTEDYFGGAWGFHGADGSDYETFTTPYLGMPQVVKPTGYMATQTRFGLYRWHIPDPIHFETGMPLVEIQALGWKSGGRYLPLQDDIASTAIFYLDRPSASRPDAPTADELELVVADPSWFSQFGNLHPTVIQHMLGRPSDVTPS